MSGLTVADLATLRESISDALARSWPDARSAGEDDAADRLVTAWESLSEMGLSGLAEDDALDALIATARQLGRQGCPVPLADAYAVARLLPGTERGEDLTAQVLGGEVRPVVHLGTINDGVVPYVDAVAGATHIAALDTEAGTLRLLPVTAYTLTPSLPRTWGEAQVGDDSADPISLESRQIDDALTIVRLFHAVRAMAAASFAADQGAEHAKVRRQFGKLVGSYQAVSHRVVNCAIDTAATEALTDDAVRLFLEQDSQWLLAADLAVTYAVGAAPRVQFGAHHTLAAIGYFEEHEAPWLFRRVQADTARCRALAVGQPDVAARLIEGGEGLPALGFGEQAAAIRAEIRSVVQDALARGLKGDDPELVELMAQHRWVAPALPEEYGGLDAAPELLLAINEEMSYWDVANFARTAAGMLGPSINKHGNETQRSTYLPMIAAGKLPFYLAYSEPETGSDLAHLRTRAVRDGDDWVVNGQKMWGTGAYRAEWGWLAARTDPEAEAHAGISIFLFPVSTPGWSFQAHTALSGERSCTSFYDDVRIPDANMIGAPGQGWQVLTEALAHERIVIASGTGLMLRLFDELLVLLRGDRHDVAGAPGSAARVTLRRLAARLQAARVLGARSSLSAMGGAGSVADAPMAKIIGSEFEEEFGVEVLALLGPDALLEGKLPADAGRTFENSLRYSIMSVVSGGTNDIQRNLVARALNLPRK